MSKKIHLETTSKTYVLFLDMLEVEDLHNVELIVNQAVKYSGNPVLPVGDMNDFDQRRAASWAGSVIFDEDEKLFKLWYYGSDRDGVAFGAIGYAWSKDGVVWHKPKLGIYEYEGSKENNICWQSQTGQIVYGTVQPRRSGHFVVVKDYKEKDADKRYKGWTGMYSEKEKKNAYFPIYSPDGIHWIVSANPAPYPLGDTTNLFIDYDEPDLGKKIKLYGHTNAGYGSDVEHCVPSPHNPVIDPKDGLEHTIHLSFVFPYRGYYIMLYDFNLWSNYYGYKGHVEVRKRDQRVPEPKTGIFIGDIRLAVNRDGVGKFQRVNPHQPLVDRGERGEWDSGFLVIPGAVVHDDKIYIFYSAADETAGALPHYEAADTSSSVQTGLAILRLDGFTSLQTRDGISPGAVTTVPIQVKNLGKTRLFVNASNLMPYRDWMEVEILDATTNKPIKGYGKDDCIDIVQEGIRIPIEWDKTETLKEIKVSEIKIRFHLYGKAKLHSFTFNP